MDCSKFDPITKVIFSTIGLVPGVFAAIAIWYICKIYCFPIEKNQKSISNQDFDEVFDDETIIKLPSYGELPKFEKELIKYIYYENLEYRKHKDYIDILSYIDSETLLSIDKIHHQTHWKLYNDLIFKYMNNRIFGYNVLFQKMIYLLRAENCIEEKQFDHLIQTNMENYIKGIDDFNKNCRSFIKSLKEKYTGKSKNTDEKKLEIELEIIEVFLDRILILVNQMVNLQKENFDNKLKYLEYYGNWSESIFSKYTNIYSQNVETLENYLNSAKDSDLIKNNNQLEYFKFEFQKLIISDHSRKREYEKRTQIMIIEISNKKYPQKEEKTIIEKYKTDFNKIISKYNQEFVDSKLKLKSNMNNFRKESMDVLLKSLGQSNGPYLSEDGEQLMKGYTETEQFNDNKISDKSDEINKIELEKYDKLITERDKIIDKEIKRLEWKYIQQIYETSLDPSNLQNVMIEHEEKVSQMKTRIKTNKKEHLKKLESLNLERKEKSQNELNVDIQTLKKDEKNIENDLQKKLRNEDILSEEALEKISKDYKSQLAINYDQMELFKIGEHKINDLKAIKEIEEAKNKSDLTINKDNIINLYTENMQTFQKNKEGLLSKSRSNPVSDSLESTKKMYQALNRGIAKETVSCARQNKKYSTEEDNYMNLFNENINNNLLADNIMTIYNKCKKDFNENKNKTVKQQRENYESKMKKNIKNSENNNLPNSKLRTITTNNNNEEEEMENLQTNFQAFQ